MSRPTGINYSSLAGHKLTYAGNRITFVDGQPVHTAPGGFSLYYNVQQRKWLYINNYVDQQTQGETKAPGSFGENLLNNVTQSVKDYSIGLPILGGGFAGSKVPILGDLSKTLEGLTTPLLIGGAIVLVIFLLK